MRTSLDPQAVLDLTKPLDAALQAFANTYPGDSGNRQPVHTVYGGAHLFKASSAHKIGQVARRHFLDYFPDPITLAHALELPGHKNLPQDNTALADLRKTLPEDPEETVNLGPVPFLDRPLLQALELPRKVHRRIQKKLENEPVEDFRIDFEDGFGPRPDAEEDQEALRTAREVARGLEAGTLPPFLGIRIKPFSLELRFRATRTLDLFFTTLVEESGGRLPSGFVVTLPKVSLREEVEACAGILTLLEESLGLDAGSIHLELMVETPQSIFGADGSCPLPGLVAAAGGRCTGAHFGIYDYTAFCGITAAEQALRHPVCDFARHVLQVSLSGTGVCISDGATNIMPVPPHRAVAGGPPLTQEQLQENREAVHRASKFNYDDVRHSLRHAYYQGWDLHPAQLPIRYAAVYSFFLESLAEATDRLRSFIDKAAQATLSGEVFDDAATGQALLNYFLRGMGCGALSEAEVLATGLTPEELSTRSFNKILEGRAAAR